VSDYLRYQGGGYAIGLVSQFQSSSRMHVMNHNWSATKQRLHPQSVAEISRHLVLPISVKLAFMIGPTSWKN